MRKQKQSSLFFVVFFVFGFFSVLQPNTVSQRTTSSATLSISTQKTEFLLGEPIKINGQFEAIGKFDGFFPSDFSYLDNVFRVHIAADDNKFRQYECRYARVVKKVEPGANFSLSLATLVYFNTKPETTGLSDKAIREKTEGKILTDYAFPRPGIYRLKASLHFYTKEGYKTGLPPSEKVESDEITIKVKEPDGDDLKVWNIIKSDTRIGVFMQQGAAGKLYPDTEENLMKEIDEIVAEYPDSYLAGILREKVVERRARLEKGRIEQQKFDEKVKRAKDPPSN